jgi:hypothetical protein
MCVHGNLGALRREDATCPRVSGSAWRSP